MATAELATMAPGPAAAPPPRRRWDVFLSAPGGSRLRRDNEALLREQVLQPLLRMLQTDHGLAVAVDDDDEVQRPLLRARTVPKASNRRRTVASTPVSPGARQARDDELILFGGITEQDDGPGDPLDPADQSENKSGSHADGDAHESTSQGRQAAGALNGDHGDLNNSSNNNSSSRHRHHGRAFTENGQAVADSDEQKVSASDQYDHRDDGDGDGDDDDDDGDDGDDDDHDDDDDEIHGSSDDDEATVDDAAKAEEPASPARAVHLPYQDRRPTDRKSASEQPSTPNFPIAAGTPEPLAISQLKPTRATNVNPPAMYRARLPGSLVKTMLSTCRGGVAVVLLGPASLQRLRTLMKLAVLFPLRQQCRLVLVCLPDISPDEVLHSPFFNAAMEAASQVTAFSTSTAAKDDTESKATTVGSSQDLAARASDAPTVWNTLVREGRVVTAPPQTGASSHALAVFLRDTILQRLGTNAVPGRSATDAFDSLEAKLEEALLLAAAKAAGGKAAASAGRAYPELLARVAATAKAAARASQVAVKLPSSTGQSAAAASSPPSTATAAQMHVEAPPTTATASNAQATVRAGPSSGVVLVSVPQTDAAQPYKTDMEPANDLAQSVAGSVATAGSQDEFADPSLANDVTTRLERVGSGDAPTEGCASSRKEPAAVERHDATAAHTLNASEKQCTDVAMLDGVQQPTVCLVKQTESEGQSPESPNPIVAPQVAATDADGSEVSDLFTSDKAEGILEPGTISAPETRLQDSLHVELDTVPRSPPPESNGTLADVSEATVLPTSTTNTVSPTECTVSERAQVVLVEVEEWSAQTASVEKFTEAEGPPEDKDPPLKRTLAEPAQQVFVDLDDSPAQTTSSEDSKGCAGSPGASAAPSSGPIYEDPAASSSVVLAKTQLDNDSAAERVASVLVVSSLLLSETTPEEQVDNAEEPTVAVLANFVVPSDQMDVPSAAGPEEPTGSMVSPVIASEELDDGGVGKHQLAHAPSSPDSVSPMSPTLADGAATNDSAGEKETSGTLECESATTTVDDGPLYPHEAFPPLPADQATAATTSSETARASIDRGDITESVTEPADAPPELDEYIARVLQAPTTEADNDAPGNVASDSAPLEASTLGEEPMADDQMPQFFPADGLVSEGTAPVLSYDDDLPAIEPPGLEEERLNTLDAPPRLPDTTGEDGATDWEDGHVPSLAAAAISDQEIAIAHEVLPSLPELAEDATGTASDLGLPPNEPPVSNDEATDPFGGPPLWPADEPATNETTPALIDDCVNLPVAVPLRFEDELAFASHAPPPLPAVASEDDEAVGSKNGGLLLLAVDHEPVTASAVLPPPPAEPTDEVAGTVSDDDLPRISPPMLEDERSNARATPPPWPADDPTTEETASALFDVGDSAVTPPLLLDDGPADAFDAPPPLTMDADQDLPAGLDGRLPGLDLFEKVGASLVIGASSPPPSGVAEKAAAMFDDGKVSPIMCSLLSEDGSGISEMPATSLADHKEKAAPGLTADHVPANAAPALGLVPADAAEVLLLPPNQLDWNVTDNEGAHRAGDNGDIKTWAHAAPITELSVDLDGPPPLQAELPQMTLDQSIIPSNPTRDAFPEGAEPSDSQAGWPAQPALSLENQATDGVDGEGMHPAEITSTQEDAVTVQVQRADAQESLAGIDTTENPGSTVMGLQDVSDTPMALPLSIEPEKLGDVAVLVPSEPSEPRQPANPLAVVPQSFSAPILGALPPDGTFVGLTPSVLTDQVSDSVNGSGADVVPEAASEWEVLHSAHEMVNEVSLDAHDPLTARSSDVSRVSEQTAAKADPLSFPVPTDATDAVDVTDVGMNGSTSVSRPLVEPSTAADKPDHQELKDPLDSLDRSDGESPEFSSPPAEGTLEASTSRQTKEVESSAETQTIQPLASSGGDGLSVSRQDTQTAGFEDPLAQAVSAPAGAEGVSTAAGVTPQEGLATLPKLATMPVRIKVGGGKATVISTPPASTTPPVTTTVPNTAQKPHAPTTGMLGPTSAQTGATLSIRTVAKTSTKSTSAQANTSTVASPVSSVAPATTSSATSDKPELASSTGLALKAEKGASPVDSISELLIICNLRDRLRAADVNALCQALEQLGLTSALVLVQRYKEEWLERSAEPSTQLPLRPSSATIEGDDQPPPEPQVQQLNSSPWGPASARRLQKELHRCAQRAGDGWQAAMAEAKRSAPIEAQESLADLPDAWMLEELQNLLPEASWLIVDALQQAPGMVRWLNSGVQTSHVRSGPASRPNRRPAWTLPPSPVQANKLAGRRDHVEELAGLLQPGRQRSRGPQIVLCGMGGMGKSILALAMAERCNERFRYGWAISGASQADLLQGLYCIAHDLQLTPALEAFNSAAEQPATESRKGGAVPGIQELQAAVEAVREELNREERAGWLLLIDNCDDRDLAARLPRLLPTIGGCVLVTSRRSDWDAHRWSSVHLGPLAGSDALMVMGARPDDKDAQHVADLLGGLPLALAHARATVRRSRIGWSVYRSRFEAAPHPLLVTAHPDDAYFGKVGLPSLLASMQRSLTPLVHRRRDAQALVQLLLPLQAGHIARALVEQAYQSVVIAARTANAAIAASATMSVQSFANVTILPKPASPEATTVSRGTLSGNQSATDAASGVSTTGPESEGTASASGMLSIGSRQPTEVIRLSRSWRQALQGARSAETILTELAAASVLALDDKRIDLNAVMQAAMKASLPPPPRWSVLVLAASLEALVEERKRMDVDLMRQFLEQAFALQRAVEAEAGAYSGESARLLATAATIHLYSLAQPKEAIGLYEQAVEIWRRRGAKPDRLLPDDVRAWASVLRRLGQAYGTVGQPLRHRDLGEEALALYERIQDRSATAATLVSLAAAADALGDPQTARTMLEKALDLDTAIYGTDHPRVAITLSNLAQAVSALGEVEHEIKLLERTLSILERHHGRDHLLTVSTLTSLGSAHGRQGDVLAQRQALERALAIHEQHPGADRSGHVRTLLEMSEACHLRQDELGRQTWLARALAVAVAENVTKKTTATVPPRTKAEPLDFDITNATTMQAAPVLLRLADLCGERREYGRQLEVLRQVLSIYKRQYGVDHPALISVLGSLAAYFDSQADLASARDIRERIIALMEPQLGPGHREVMRQLTLLNSLYRRLGQVAQHKQTLERLLALQGWHLGDDHKEVGITSFELAALNQQLGDEDTAQVLVERALPILEREFGRDHPVSRQARKAYKALTRPKWLRWATA